MMTREIYLVRDIDQLFNITGGLRQAIGEV